MGGQPTGTVTLVFTDVEGSTRLLERLGPVRYRESLELHRRLLRESFARHDGYEVDCEGDAFFISFGSAAAAVAAAAEAQQALAAAEWPEGLPIRVRMGIHSGEPLPAPPKYVGLDVHKAARVMAAGHGGQVLLTQATRELIPAEVTVADCGVHRLKDLLQPEPLYQLLAPGLREEFPALKTLGNRPTNLPVVATAFIGRVRELAAVHDLLCRDDVRLLTLTGPGGIGKTRLALQAAAEATDRFRDGVYWIPFAPVRDSSLVAATLAQTLGVREEPDEPIEATIARYLNGKHLLLLLDNLEHLIGAARALASTVLRDAPQVQVLATSREALRIAGEHLYDVPPLALPERRGQAEPNDAVQLFVSRARAVDARFELTAATETAVAEIVQQLEGLPLAIELAAARIRALPPAALLERLHDRLRLLTTGTHDADERQRTLRATIEWSYDLLPPAEKKLFSRLSVFVGGCRVDAAEAVCECDGELAIDVLDGISSLLDKSLLRRRDDFDGQPRYWMLETIREFAAARLHETADEERVVGLRHAEWYRDLALANDNRIRSVELRRRLEPEAPNVRAALATFGAVGAVDEEVRLSAQIANSGYLRGAVAEGRALIESALGRGGASAATRAYALDALATLIIMQGGYEDAFAHAEEALSAARQAGDARMEAAFLVTVGWSAHGLGDPSRARSSYDAAVRIGNEVGDDVTVAAALGNLADLALASGSFPEALRTASQAIDANARAGNDASRAVSLFNVAQAELALGDIDAAFRHAIDALTILRVVDRDYLHACVLLVAAVRAARGDAETAARLLGTADSLSEQIGSVFPAAEAALRDRTAHDLVQVLGSERFERLRLEGRTLDETAALAE